MKVLVGGKACGHISEHRRTGSLIAERVWAGLVAILLATLSSVANFFLIPY